MQGLLDLPSPLKFFLLGLLLGIVIHEPVTVVIGL